MAFKRDVDVLKGANSTPGKKPDNIKEEGIVFATDYAPKRVSVVQRGKTDEKVPFLRVRIGGVLAEKMKLKAGDKVSLLWDEERRLGIIEEHKDGWMLTGLNRRKPGEPEFDGYQPLQLRYTWKRGVPSIYEPKLCREVVVIKGDLGNNCIQFVYPEGTSFDKLSKPPKDEEEPATNVVQYNRRASDRQPAQAAAR